MYTKREFSIARWGRGRKSAQSGQLKLDQFVQRTFTTTSIQGFHGFDFLSAQSTKELLMSSVDFLHNYRLSPWQQQHHVTTLLPQRPGTATYRNGTSSRNGTLRRWPHIVLRLITAFSQMQLPPPHSIFMIFLKPFGFALKQFHICLCLFGHKKVLFEGLAEGERGVQFDEWRQMGGNRQRTNDFASRWFSCHHVTELKPMRALSFWVSHAQGEPGNK